jgi:ABC-type phosphate/phosphonate transport system substrate-binding protein
MVHAKYVVCGAVLVLAGAAAAPDSKAKPAPAAAPAAPAAPADAPPPPIPDADAADDDGTAAAAPTLLSVGAARTIGMQAVAFAAQGLRQSLTQAFGGPVATVLYPDSGALADALAAGKVDAAWLPPLAYVRAAEQGKVRVVLGLTRAGTANYRSAIFVKAGSPLAKLDDLKGKSIIWVAAPSASGRLFPRAHLLAQGKDPDKFFGAQSEGRDHRGRHHHRRDRAGRQAHRRRLPRGRLRPREVRRPRAHEPHPQRRHRGARGPVARARGEAQGHAARHARQRGRQDPHEGDLPRRRLRRGEGRRLQPRARGPQDREEVAVPQPPAPPSASRAAAGSSVCVPGMGTTWR